MRNRGRRWWSVYLADGTRLEDVEMTAACIRATLPGAVIDTRIGRITISQIDQVHRPIQGAKVAEEVDAE